MTRHEMLPKEQKGNKQQQSASIRQAKLQQVRKRSIGAAMKRKRGRWISSQGGEKGPRHVDGAKVVRRAKEGGSQPLVYDST